MTGERATRAASAKLHPEAVAILERYADKGGPNPYLRDAARRFGESGRLSPGQAEAVVEAERRGITPGQAADRADIRRRERGRDLYLEGKVRAAGEGVYLVERSGGDEPYRVSLYPESCPCPDAEKGHRCKHVYAALADEKDLAAEAREEYQR